MQLFRRWHLPQTFASELSAPANRSPHGFIFSICVGPLDMEPMKYAQIHARVTTLVFKYLFWPNPRELP